MSFTILGTGYSLPKRIIKNDDLSRIVDTSDEWIVSKTGIKERHILTDETISDIAFDAAKKAIENADIAAADIDMILFSTICGDTYTPSMACLIANMLQISCPGFDINAACSGFVYALDVAAGFFVRKRVKRVLIICAEQMSRHIDWTDRATCVLFGDGASAVVLGEGDDLLSIRLTATPNRQLMNIPFTGGNSPYKAREFEKPYLYMNGQEIYRFAVSSSYADLKFVMQQASIEEKDVGYVLLHQANLRIVNAIKDKLSINPEKYLNCIDKTGNISSVMIPILLDEGNRHGLFKNGDILALSAFGGGLTTGAALIRWSKGH